MRRTAALVLMAMAVPAAAQQHAPARGLTGAYDPNNPFARILRGELPASKVYEDATVLVLMPLTMAKPGHVLVIPKRLGARTLLDLTPAELTACMVAAQKAGRAQVAALGATGFQIRQNNGADAGQDVFHPHLHVIPFVGPDRTLRPDAERNTRDELDAMAARLRGCARLGQRSDVMRTPLFAAALLLPAAAVAAPAPVTGRWLTAEGKAIVEIAPCGAQLCGRIARVLKPRPGGPAVDANNPDSAKRGQPIEGLTILTGLTASGDRWNGRIYDPESGRTYRSELVGQGNQLKVRGCFGPFCRTQTWTRTR